MILLDTSVLIEYLRVKDKHTTCFYKLTDVIDEELFTATTVIQELYVGQSTRHRDENTRIHHLLKSMNIVAPSALSAEIAGTLLRDNLIPAKEFSDAQIAGLCLEQSATLATLNPRHFSQVPSLKLFDFASV